MTNYLLFYLKFKSRNILIMIQRIQTLFLALASIVAAAFLFVPSVEINDLFLTGMNDTIMLILTVIASLACLGAIFLFKNRTLQANIGRISLLPILGLIGYAVFKELSDGDFAPNFLGLALPVVAIIFVFLAVNAINKDEKMVRSSDRLR